MTAALERLRAALSAVDVGDFVPRAAGDDAVPVSIGHGQTHTPAATVALLARQAGLEAGERLLEVGSGSGYAAAVYSACGAEVFAVERLEALADAAAARLASLGVTVRCGDGLLGWPEAAPFDVIIAAGSVRRVPAAWFAQLAEGGRLIVPVAAPDGHQELVRYTREGRQLRRTGLGPARFTPLVAAP